MKIPKNSSLKTQPLRFYFAYQITSSTSAAHLTADSEQSLLNMTSSPYFVWTTKTPVSVKQAEAINAAVQAIDPDATFCRLNVPGNSTRGWIERPNDGRNESNDQRAKAARMIEAAQRVLGRAE